MVFWESLSAVNEIFSEANQHYSSFDTRGGRREVVIAAFNKRKDRPMLNTSDLKKYLVEIPYLTE